MMLSNKLRQWAHGDRKGLIYWCQGCNSHHSITTEGAGAWSWNGDVEKPVFTPSVLVTYPGADAGREGAPPAVCHTFVGCNGAQPGEVIFLSDCTHALAGTVQPLPDLPAHADAFGSNEPNHGQYIELDENGNIKPAPKASEPSPPVAPERGGG